MELVNKTIGQCLRERARKTGDIVGLEIDSWNCTYGQLDLYVDRMVIQMNRLGIRHGMHVGIWGINSAEWVVTFLALARMGAVPILFNSLYTQEEMKTVLNYSDVEFLYYGKGNKNLDYSEIKADIILDVPRIRFYVELQDKELRTISVLKEVGERIYGAYNPNDILFREDIYRIDRNENTLSIYLPFANKEELKLEQMEEELVIGVKNETRRFLMPKEFWN